jgi:hypothetical protein
MIKYKHIPTGHIWVKSEIAEAYWREDKSEIMPTLPEIVETGKDWEKIEDDTEEYEITGVRYIELGDIARKIDNSDDFEYIRTGKQMSIETVHENLTKGKLEIFSVLRKSDNQEFKVGNTINWRHSLLDIKAFHLNCGKMFMLAKGANGIQSVNLNEILIWEKPVLFTTEDGKEIREGDNWFAVTYSSNIVGRNYIDSTHDEKKHFSTLDSAKEYVIENKPIFTLQDMLAWGQFCSDNDSTHPCFYPKDLARERCGFIKK